MTDGIAYIAFGKKAQREAEKSILSIRDVGVNLPVISVGDIGVSGTLFRSWKLSTPFCGDGKFSFRAGEVKPFLCKLSPFQNTLYLDADTTIKKDFTAGFDYLRGNDICVSYHVNPAGETWYVDEVFGDPKLSPKISHSSVKERELTQGMIGNKRMPFVNTGVIFFRASNITEVFFQTWYREWMIFRDWDEQMAFHRAMVRCPETKVLLLPPVWNQKYENKDTIILHRMGQRKARRERL